MTHVERLRKMVELWRDGSEERRLELASIMLGYAELHHDALAEILSMPVDAVGPWFMQLCADAVIAGPEPRDLDAAILQRGAAALVAAIEGAAALQVWKTGDAVTIEFEGRTLRASVLLASRNGRSLALQFEGIVGGYVGMMPAMWNDGQRTFVDIMEHRPVVVRAEVSDG